MYYYKRQFDPIAESERNFLCRGFQDDWTVCRYHNLPLFPLTIFLHAHSKDNTDIHKNKWTFSLTLWKILQSPKAPAVSSGMPEQQLENFSTSKTSLCLRYFDQNISFSVKIFYFFLLEMLWHSTLKVLCFKRSCSYNFRLQQV